MWMWTLVALGAEFGREDEALSTTRYNRLVGDGPVYGRWRSRRGVYVATHFRDGQIEHFDLYDGRSLTETRTFAADGTLRAVVDWTKSVVTLEATGTTVEFADWKRLDLAGVEFRAPDLEQVDGVWTGRRIAIEVQPRADPFSTDFAVALAAGCGCEIEARLTTWIAGRPAAHYRLQRPRATADVIALPIRDGVLVLTAAGPDLESLAPLRAMMATARLP